jgi:BirA family biotin operon repressor/biotin-[acetyl-CoA-carboxylase] ligase
MDRAEMLASRGAPERTIVTADRQTAGRGRAGRQWHNQPGTALQLTAILRPGTPPGRLPILSLLAGVAVAEAIEAATGAEVKLKWPNDVWLGADPERPKVGGILATSRLKGERIGHVLAGIGININSLHSHLPPGATSLREATGWPGSPEQLLRALLPELDRVYGEYVLAEGRPSLDAWRMRAALIGEVVCIEEHGMLLTGVLAGIDDDGALLLGTPGSGITRVLSGDLVRGPRRVSDSGA